MVDLEKVDDDSSKRGLRCKRGKTKIVFMIGKRDRVNDGERKLVGKFMVVLRKLP